MRYVFETYIAISGWRLKKDFFQHNHFIFYRVVHGLLSNQLGTLVLNLPTKKSSMKEQLRLFWNHTDEKKARRFLAIWCRDAWHSGIKQLADVAKTLASYRTGLLTI
jgi:hypothetical protein